MGWRDITHFPYSYGKMCDISPRSFTFILCFYHIAAADVCIMMLYCGGYSWLKQRVSTSVSELTDTATICHSCEFSKIANPVWCKMCDMSPAHTQSLYDCITQQQQMCVSWCRTVLPEVLKPCPFVKDFYFHFMFYVITFIILISVA